jgi:hypothetical protein
VSALAERIAAQSAVLAERSIAEMYQNPFWQDRFGAGGRELVGKEVQIHLALLIRALVAADPGIMTDHARSLQTQLASRGMCSRHLEDTFERLERALGDLVADSEPARELLRAARAALVYERGTARELQLLSEPLAEKTLDAISSQKPGWFSAASSYVSLASFESVTQAERARWKSDVLELLSFLADALHADRAELFCAYALSAQDFFARRQAPVGRVEETLLGLLDCLPPPARSPKERSLPPAMASAPRAGSLRPGSLRPGSLRPPLSEPPPPPVPLAMSAELAERARVVLGSALERVRAG